MSIKNATSTVVRFLLALCVLAGVPAATRAQSETGPVARFTTSAGTVTFTLFDSKPITTTNFINIITAGNYNNVILNRNPQDFVIQGGGYFAPSTNNGVPANTPNVSAIQGEPGTSNIRGTLAMALSTGPNSGTKEFFFNLGDNSSLDNATLPDGRPTGGPFTVFGRVRGASDQATLDAINNLAKFTICSTIQPPQPCTGQEDRSPFGRVPLIGYSGTGAIAPTNYVIIQLAEVSPQIRTQPVAQAVFTNQNATFTVAAVGTGTLSYQWRRNGVNLSNGGAISGATTASLTITGAQAGNAGQYDCLVSNNVTTSLGIAAAASAAVALTVNAPPSIDTQPSNVTVTAGGNASFTVAASGAGTLTYQWRRGTTNLSNGGSISGATTPTLTITGVATGDAGNYNCQVTNAAGTSTSNDGVLTVNTLPQITSNPSNSTVNAGQNASFTVSASGSPSPTFQWRKGTTNLANGGNISGATSATLSLTGVTAGDAGSYNCVVTNAAGSATSTSATLTVNTPPGFASQPSDATVTAGQNASFTVSTTGSPAPTFQWRKGTTNLANGGNITGATTATLSLTGVTAGDAGSYNCVITNVAGTATSNSAVLTVNVPPSITSQPSNTTAAVGQNATFTVAASGTATLNYQWRKGTTNLTNAGSISGATSATLTITGVVAGDAGSYNCVVTNGVGSATSNDATLAVTNAPFITTQPTSNGVALGGSATLMVAASGTPTLNYQWRRGGVALSNGTTAAGTGVSGATSFLLTLSNLQQADITSYDCVVTNASGSATSNSVTLQVVALPQITMQPANATVTMGGTATFTAAATGQFLTFQWRRDGLALANSAKYSGVSTASLTISNVQQSDFGSYDLLVSNGAGSVTTIVVNLTIVDPPVITAPVSPSTITRDPGQSAIFSVTVVGENLSFQWRRDGTPLSSGGRIMGATGSTLTVSSLGAGDAGVYTCLVSNIAGNATSQGVTLVVNTAPSITQQPANTTVNQGASASFTVAATGPGTLSYQWFMGAPGSGTPINGATTATLTLLNVQASAAGSYYCAVTNSVGTTNTNAATLTVNTPPMITSNPSPLTQAVNTNATFSVGATGAGPLTYRWRRNGVNLATNNARLVGVTSATLTINNLVAADAGNYSCVVTGVLSPAATSASAQLVVVSPPTIVTNPVNQTVDPLEAVTMTISATGGQIAYQWRKGGMNLSDSARISGTTGPGLTITGVLPGTDNGSYDCVVTNIAGNATSTAATLTVRDIPYFTAQPVSVPVGIAGQTASFSVTAMGTGPISYQWFKGTAPNGTPVSDGSGISGATSATLTFNPIAGSHAGSYYCVASNANGSTTSGAASLTVFFPPTITVADPSGNVYYVMGSTHTLSVTAEGSPTLTYQWFKGAGAKGTATPGDVPIPDATGPTYTISNAQLADAGRYRCQVTNPYGTAFSSTVFVSVGDAPAVTGGTRPPTLDVAQNGGTTLSVTNTGTPIVSYQWRRNGTNLVDTVTRGVGATGYFGTQTATLTISNAQNDGTGVYDCVLTNNFGTATSSSSDITVVAVPEITQQPPTFSFGYTGGSLSISVQAVGGHLNYQWQNSINNSDYVDLVDGPATTLGGISTTATISGANTPTLTFTGIDFAFLFAQFNRCVVTNTAGQVVSTFGIALRSGQPQVTVDPVNSPATLGQTATFTSTFHTDGPGGPLTYKWFHNDVEITDAAGGRISGFAGTATPTGNPNEFSATLTIQNVQESDAGDYYCFVLDPSPLSSRSHDASLLQGRPITIQQNHVNGGFYAAPGSFSTIHVFRGSGPFTVTWRKNGMPIVTDSRVTITPVFDIGEGLRATQLNFNTTDPNDTGFYDVVICTPPGGDTYCVGSQGGTITFGFPPSSDGIVGFRDIPVGGTLDLTQLIDGGTGPFSYQWYKDTVSLSNDERVSGVDTANLKITGMMLNDAGQYTCRVISPFGFFDAVVQVQVGTPPSIVQFTSGPVNVANGGSFNLSVEASGDPTLNYQWRLNGSPLSDGGGYAGTTTNMLSVSNAKFNFGGSYTCEVTNLFGNATTGTITVNVQGVAPNITMNPAAKTIRPNSVVVSLSVLATGDPTPTYAWFRRDGMSETALTNGGRISGASTAMLTITGLADDDYGTYFARATNVQGTATSGDAVIEKLEVPAFVEQPGDQSVNSGDTATFTARIDPTKQADNGFNFTWKLNGNAVSGMQFSSTVDMGDPYRVRLTITGAQAGDAGAYTVTVSNGSGSTTSNAGTLTVASACRLDFNQDGTINPDDIGDFISAYFTTPPVAGPGGYAVPCPGNDPPYDQGYIAGYNSDGSGQCGEPFPDNLGDWLTDYFLQVGVGCAS